MAARRRRDNIAFGVLAALAVIGGLNAIFGFFKSDPPGPSDANTAVIVGHAQLAGSFAAEFVTTYLSAGAGQQEKMARYVNVGQITLPKTGRQVQDPSVVYVQRAIDNGELEVWAVTVSVRIGSGSSASSAPRQFYRVAVTVATGQVRALSLPAAVGPPAGGLDLSQRYNAPCSNETPLATVAAGFLGAFLTGTGDVNRYISQDAGITALAPAPYSSLANVAVSATDSSCGEKGSSARVLATVTPKLDSGELAPLAYPLTMVRSGGQWQVQALDSIPALTEPLTAIANNQSKAAAGATTTTPSVGSTGTETIPPATHK
ncbi:MAG: conjugal transfer protein [Mycobacteriaceae bacterium]|nr:conjugal transfer protein [Mycobacteriaceae bacterium]